jgi:hypothetical protein
MNHVRSFQGENTCLLGLRSVYRLSDNVHMQVVECLLLIKHYVHFILDTVRLFVYRVSQEFGATLQERTEGSL